MVKVALAQLNCTVGDLTGNAQKILNAAAQAFEQGARIVVSPELSLTGYPPEDLLLRPAFLAEVDRVLARLRQDLARFPGLHVIVGVPRQVGHDCFNMAVVLADGQEAAAYAKQELPNYGVFDEPRYFTPGQHAVTFTVGQVCFGLALCEDVWFARTPQAAQQAGAQCLLVPNASPFEMAKHAQRAASLAQTVCADSKMALLYTNLVGGQDELVFDGGSFAMEADGTVKALAKAFQEDLLMVEVDASGRILGRRETPLSEEAEVYQALSLGVADYVKKNGFPGVLLGLSGGIDSALVLAIAVDALGADKVRAVMMPSRYTADISAIDARDMAQRLGVRYDEIAIASLAEAFDASLADTFAGLPADVAEENIQARIRGTLLMALSNKFGPLVLTTGNKSELTTGYCTLYGDMAGGFAVLKDLVKTWVYRLSRWRNTLSPVIPERIITRPPSAELRPDQTDQDSLPPYELLDDIVQRYVERGQSQQEIIAAGLPADEVRRIIKLLRINEYKRRQAPVGVRVSPCAFGRDWRYPITNRFTETPIDNP
ncbi:MAG: NAD+ synthase [Pigmentiphaga sp.]|nr:NAD+ synthase [Pigmentiphaga sp.]